MTNASDYETASLSDDKQSLLRAQVGADFKEQIDRIDLLYSSIEEQATAIKEIFEALNNGKRARNDVRERVTEWTGVVTDLRERITALEAACEFCISKLDRREETQ